MGSCYACECTSWLPQSIGNLQIKSLSDIIDGSDMRSDLQSTIADGTYSFCNEHQCSYIKSDLFADGKKPTHIKHLRLAIDDSCNLRCPSCRKGMIFHKEGSAYNLGITTGGQDQRMVVQLQAPNTGAHRVRRRSFRFSRVQALHGADTGA